MLRGEWRSLRRRSLRIRILVVRGRVRYAGPRRIRVTDGHEAEAKAAQLRKPPNRVGLFFLRMLGLHSDVAHSASGHTHRATAGARCAERTPSSGASRRSC
jgi:hypothetical protein